MGRNAFIGIAIALLVPLLGYFLMKGFTDRATAMPRHYIYDSVVTKVEKGKEVTDTLWHKVPDYSFINHLGQSVQMNDLDGKILVANFFFTRCPTICPKLTQNMKYLQESVHNAQKVGDRVPEFVHFLSFSVDPERDSVPALKSWANRFQINAQNWWLMTGDKKTIYDLSLNHLKLALVDGNAVDTSFIHTDRFVLIDKNRTIRGYYHGLDSASLRQLSRDIIFLSLEKDPNRKSIFAGKLELLAIVFLLTLIGLGLLFYFLKRKP
ncbi:MAG TPA: SCO family protein [Chitinophagaceae bacterium]|jgi:protein SCO1/2|nr:SCO family protein [Chitinophagaceae bacterium]